MTSSPVGSHVGCTASFDEPCMLVVQFSAAQTSKETKLGFVPQFGSIFSATISVVTLFKTMSSEGNSSNTVLSRFAESLAADAKLRYMHAAQKIALVDLYDPYLGVPAKAKTVILPVDATDLLSYLVLGTSFITAEQFKARKGLEAYNQFCSGWVKDVKYFEHVEVYNPYQSPSFKAIY